MQKQTQFFQDEQENFCYQKFKNSTCLVVPAIAQNAKYNTILSLQKLNFLEYYMLPQKDQFSYVYRPGDDSFFMLNVLKQQINSWIDYWGEQPKSSQGKQFYNCTIAQLGSGSGIISAHVSSWLRQINKSPLMHVSIDINMDASLLSQKYYDYYKLPILQINTSLFKNTKISLKKSAKNMQIRPQIILFNPPYIPVQEQEIENQEKYLKQKIKHLRENKTCVRQRQQNMIAYSYMGGLDGLSVTRKLLKSLFWDCWVYLIIMGEEGYIQISDQIGNYKQFWSQHEHYDILGKVQLMQFMQYQNEHLFLIKVQINSKQR